MSGGAETATDRFRVIIADDEPIARRTIERLLAVDDEIEVVGESAGPDAAELVVAQKPDLLLLDIQMPERTGFEVLEAIPRRAMPLVIFITAHDEYAVRAFEERALDYLLKPFSNQRFYEAMNRAKGVLRRREAEVAQRRLLAFLASRRTEGLSAPTTFAATQGEPIGGPADRIAMREGGRTVVFRSAEVAWIGAAGPYAEVHGKRGTQVVRVSLAALESRLDPNRFFRVHRSAIVNLDHVVELKHVSHGDYAVVLRDNTTLKLSRSRREELEARLGT